MLEAIATMATSGVVGLLGPILSRIGAYYEREQKHKHDMARFDKEKELAVLEMQSSERMQAQDTHARMEVSADNALAESLRASVSRMSTGDSKLLVVVDFVRGMVRPTLTVSFLIVSTVLFFSLAPSDNLRGRALLTILYLTETSVLWWFGSRPAKPAPRPE